MGGGAAPSPEGRGHGPDSGGGRPRLVGGAREKHNIRLDAESGEVGGRGAVGGAGADDGGL